MNALKPCGLCDNPATVKISSQRSTVALWFAKCVGCGAESQRTHVNRQDAVDYWNEFQDHLAVGNVDG